MQYVSHKELVAMHVVLEAVESLHPVERARVFRWVNEVLEPDPAPAGVAIVAPEIRVAA